MKALSANSFKPLLQALAFMVILITALTACRLIYSMTHPVDGLGACDFY